jgi:energy-coupling factor transport system permease protein
VTYLRRASPLHAARAVVGTAWSLALAACVFAIEHPLVLGAMLASVLVAAASCGVARPVLSVLKWGVPFALVIALVNPIVSRDGVTVLLRGGEVPALGQVDITLEAVVYGGVMGLRALTLIAIFALHSAAVDPDDLLRSFRRISFRTALSAALATRMVPVLGRDARRMADAQQALPGPAAGRVTLLRAVASGALDRAVDVAATLELRGYGGAGRPAARHRPWSRHDLAFSASAVVLLVLALAADAPFDARPRLLVPLDAGVLLTAGAVAAAMLAPFADRRGVGG